MNRLFEAIDRLDSFTLEEKRDSNLHFVAVMADDVVDFIRSNKRKVVDAYKDRAYCFFFIKGLPSGDWVDSVDDEDGFLEDEYPEFEQHEEYLDDEGYIKEDVLYLPNGDVNKDFLIKLLGLTKWDGDYYTYEGDYRHVYIPGVTEKEYDESEKLSETNKEYRYITNHGVGPGMCPKDIFIRSEDLDNGKTAIYLSRPLTDEELKKYDIKPEYIQEDEEYDENDIDIEADLTEALNNDAVSYSTLEKVFSDYMTQREYNKMLKDCGLSNKDVVPDKEFVLNYLEWAPDKEIIEALKAGQLKWIFGYSEYDEDEY